MKFSSFAGVFAAALSASCAFAAPVEERQLPPLPGIDEVVTAVVKLAQNIVTQVNADNKGREEFTKQTIQGMYDNESRYNYVIVHTDHEYTWDGEQGTDWQHSHQEFDIVIGGTVGYEIYVAKGGSFTLKGDGGFLNWAFIGDIVSDDGGNHPRNLVFGNPQE